VTKKAIRNTNKRTKITFVVNKLHHKASKRCKAYSLGAAVEGHVVLVQIPIIIEKKDWIVRQTIWQKLNICKQNITGLHNM